MGEAQCDGVRRARYEGTTDGGPAHEWRDGTDDGADPCVPDGAALHPGIWTGIEGDVRCAEEGRRRVAHGPEEGRTGEARGGCKGGGVRRAEDATDERARTGAGHLRVVRDFLELVERVGRGAAEGGA